MNNIIYALKNLFRNFLNWHGWLSKEGYLWTWAGILAVNASLLFLRKTILFSVLFSINCYNEHISKIITYGISIWNLVIFFPVMFATMRRYHDSGKAGWNVILVNGLSLVLIVLGLLIGSFIVIGFIFGGGYMVTASTDVTMSGFLGLTALSVFLLLAGVGLALLNIKYILQESDPMENVYGKPTPFMPD